MKILLIDSLDHYGGVTTHIINLANVLNELGCSVTLMAPNIDIYKKNIHRGIELIQFCKFNLKKDFPINFLNQFDIINSNAYVEVNTYLLEMSKRKFKLIITIHEVMKSESIKIYHEYYDKLKKSDCIVTVSLAARKILIENGFKESLIETIYNGIEVENQSSQYKRKDIAFVGRLAEEKNILGLLEAMSELENDDIKLNIYGDGNMKEQLELYIEKYHMRNRCILHGFNNNIKDILRKHKILILPSITESCSYTLLEGMSNHIFVIASECDGNRELVINNVTGAIVNCNDPAMLAQNIQYWYFHDEQRIALIENAFYRIKKYYTIKEMGKNFLDLYKKLL